MRKQVLMASLVAMMVLPLAPLPSLAAAPVDASSKAHTYTFKTTLSQAECKAMANADPQHANAILNHCYRTTTFTLGPLVTAAKPSTGQLQPMVSGCSDRGWSWGDLTDDALWWRVEVKAYFHLDTCNNVYWYNITCNYSWVWPWSISQNWCGAAPSANTYYYYTQTYAGIHYVASTLLAGGTHGYTYGIDPIHYSYYNITRW